MSVRISRLSDIFPSSPTEVTNPVATFQQLQQLLEQSLRDLPTDSSERGSAQERELIQALQRLSGRLHHILDDSTDSGYSGEMKPSGPSPKTLTPATIPLTQGPIHLLTSCDGVILMANDLAVEVLGVDVLSLGTVSLAEWIPYDEWRLIRQHIKSAQPPQDSVTWVVNLGPPGVAVKRMTCTVIPMVDQSQKVTAWHWDLRSHHDPVPSHSFASLIGGLETDLLKGQCLNDCLKYVCEGLVQTFGYPFVWIATVQDSQPIQLRAQASASDLDWDVQGSLWWDSISRQEMLAQACVASEGSLISCKTPYTGEFAWFPSGFHLQEAYSLPLSQGNLSGLLVVCSKASNRFNSAVRGWLEGLGHLIEDLLGRGIEMEQFRLHSAVIGSVQEAVCVTDPHGRVEWVNQAYSKLLGVTSYQLVGKPFRTFPHAQLHGIWSDIDPAITEIGCVKTEVMEKGRHGESLVLDQVLTPIVDAQGKITHFVIVLHDVTARAVAVMQMKHQAYHDALTDLPNRVMFEDRLQLALAQSRRDGTLVALLFLDLDNFKSINDQHGHQIGDRLLRVVAKRLVTCVRTTDTVSRLSGDEFTIILQGFDRIQDIRQVAQKIVDCLIAPIPLGGQNIPIQTSIGIAVSPKDSTDPNSLLAIADRAMYRAKHFGGQRWYFATSEWNME